MTKFPMLRGQDPHVTFAQSVGVSPGTTTMQLGAKRKVVHSRKPLRGGAVTCLDGTGDCPADEMQMYTVPPVVMTSADFTNDSAAGFFPYATIEELKGRALNGLSDASDIAPRWGLVVLAGFAVFAAVLGFQRFRR